MSSWTRYYRATPEPLRRPTGTHWVQARELMRTTPRMILILKRASSTATWREILAQRMATIWWQELKNGFAMRKSHTAPRVHPQGSRKRNRFTSQPQFRSEDTPAVIEADQILLALQHLAYNNNPANFHNTITKNSKLPKSLTTTMPTFGGKSEKFELFEELFQTSLKNHNQLTEDDRINYFHSLMKGDALQTFENISGPTREKLRDILAVFPRKYVKPQSMATAKHKFQKLVFNPANQKLVNFLNETNKLTNDAIGIAAHANIEQFIYAKTPPHVKKSINQAHSENGTYEQIVTHLERELELNGFEAPDELQINTVSQQPTNTNADRTKSTWHHCKKTGVYRNQYRLLKKQRERTEKNQNNPGKKQWRQ